MFLPIGLFNVTGLAIRTLLTTPLTAAVIGITAAAILVGLLFLLFGAGAGRGLRGICRPGQ